jgi:hypothetical protein
MLLDLREDGTYSELTYLSELTLWWEVVHVLAPQTNRDMREMKERYIERVMGGRAPETRYVITCIDPCRTTRS